MTSPGLWSEYAEASMISAPMTTIVQVAVVSRSTNRGDRRAQAPAANATQSCHRVH
jgi:hypothetical protein